MSDDRDDEGRDARMSTVPLDEALIERFWHLASSQARFTMMPGYFPQSVLEMVQPPAWSFGRESEQADHLLSLVLDGTKTATSSAAADYEREGEPLPQPGSLGIILDGTGTPRALIATTEVRVVTFDEVDAEHARLEGEGDRSLEHWRSVHEAFFAETCTFSPDMRVVLEQFSVLYQH